MAQADIFTQLDDMRARGEIDEVEHKRAVEIVSKANGRRIVRKAQREVFDQQPISKLPGTLFKIAMALVFWGLVYSYFFG